MIVTLAYAGFFYSSKQLTKPFGEDEITDENQICVLPLLTKGKEFEQRLALPTLLLMDNGIRGKCDQQKQWKAHRVTESVRGRLGNMLHKVSGHGHTKEPGYKAAPAALSEDYLRLSDPKCCHQEDRWKSHMTAQRYQNTSNQFAGSSFI